MRKSYMEFALTVCLVPLSGVCHAQTVAIVGATVIDGNGREPIFNGVIVIRDQEILSVGKKGRVQIPDDAKVMGEATERITGGKSAQHVSREAHFVYRCPAQDRRCTTCEVGEG